MTNQSILDNILVYRTIILHHLRRTGLPVVYKEVQYSTSTSRKKAIMATKPTTRRRTGAARKAALAIVASISLAADLPAKPVEIRGLAMQDETLVSDFIESLNNAHTLKLQEVPSILAVSQLRAWLSEEKLIYVCVHDGKTVHCCTLVIKDTEMQLVPQDPTETIAEGAIWLMALS